MCKRIILQIGSSHKFLTMPPAIAMTLSPRLVFSRVRCELGSFPALLGTRIPLVVVALLVLAFMIRLSWILLVDSQPVSDYLWYYECAIDISSGKGYSINGSPTAYWPVGYPATLGLMFAVFGSSVFVGKILNLILSVGSLFVAYQIAKKLFASEFVGRMTLLILAFYPNQIAYTSVLSPEILSLFLLLLGIILLIDVHNAWSILISGIIFGLACLVKPQVLFVPGIIIVFGRVGTERNRILEKLSLLVRVYALIAITILPWTIRNYFAFGSLIFVSNNGGINLFIGNNPEANGEYVYNDRMIAMLGDTKNERDKDLKASKVALEYISNNPWETVRLWPIKLWYLFRSDVEGISWSAAGVESNNSRDLSIFTFLKILAQSYYLLIVVAFLISIPILLSRRNRHYRQPFPTVGLYIILYFTSIYLAYFGGSRFHFPMMPWIVMYGAAGTDALLAKRRAPQIKLSQITPRQGSHN